MEIRFDKGEIIKIREEELELLSQKAIYWEGQSTLFIADLHLGKGKHFQKNGIAIPESASNKNWILLHQLFRIEGLKKVIFLGDLFHSAYNRDCVVFKELIDLYPSLKFELVLGNHDVLDPDLYLNMGLEVHQEILSIPPFIFSHEPLEEEQQKGLYNLAGHIHPGVKMRGKGKQSLRVACFHFGKTKALLPAFGSLTGLHLIEVKKEDSVFVVVDDQVIPIQ